MRAMHGGMKRYDAQLNRDIAAGTNLTREDLTVFTEGWPNLKGAHTWKDTLVFLNGILQIEGGDYTRGAKPELGELVFKFDLEGNEKHRCVITLLCLS